MWRGLNFLSVFILNVLVARLFEATQAGALFFFINNLSLVILLLSFSLESGLGFYAAGAKISNKKLRVIALIWCIAASLISLLLFDHIAHYLFPVSGINAKTAAVCFVAGSLLTSFFSSLYFSKENFVIPNVLLLLINLVLIGVFIAGMQGMVNNQWLIYSYFFGFLIQGILIAVFYFFKKENGVEGLSAQDDIKKVISYSSTVFLGNIVFFLVYRIDYWFVERYCTTAELGNYIQVSKIVQWLMLLPMMISTVVFPLTAIGKDKEIVNKVIAVSRFLLWLYVIGCIIIALAGYWVFPWLFGKTYTYMYPVFLLYIPGILALASLYPVSSYNAGINRAGINLQGSLLALIIIIALNISFTPVYGIYAASVAGSIGYIVYFSFSFYKFNRLHKTSLSQIFKPAISDYALLKSMLARRK